MQSFLNQFSPLIFPGVYRRPVLLCAYTYGCELFATSPPTRHQDPSDQSGGLAHRVLRAVREKLQLHTDGHQSQRRRSLRPQRPGNLNQKFIPILRHDRALIVRFYSIKLLF